MRERPSSGFSETFPAPSALPGLAFWEWNYNEDRLSWSPEWAALLGFAEGATAAGNGWEHLHEEDETKFRKACRDCAEGRIPYVEAAIRVCRVDESVAWVLAKGEARGKGAKRPDRVTGYVTEITRLRIDTDFLPRARDNAETYRAMLDHAPSPLIRFDRDLFPLYINAAISRYLPAKPEELGASTYADLGIDEEQRLFYQNSVRKVFEHGKPVEAIRTFHTPVSGDLTSEVSFWPEFGPDGTVNAVMCRVHDITARARIDQEMRLSEERFAALYRLAQMQDEPEDEIVRFVVEQIAVLSKSKHSFMFFPETPDGDRGRVYWSQSLHNLVGPEVLPADRLPPPVALARDPEQDPNRPFIVNSDFGRYAFGVLPVYRHMSTALTENDRTVCIASVCNKDTDYSETDLRQVDLFIRGVYLLLRRKRYVHDLKTAKVAAEEASRVKDEFLANVSHELRTPLNGMLSMLQLLQMSPLSMEQQEYVQTASVSGKALLRILSDILDYSRMGSGQMGLHSGLFDPRATLLSSMNTLEGEARRKGLGMTVNIDENLPETLLGDDSRVRQIVFNLAGNALKFTEQGGITLECSMLPHTARGKVWLHLVVSDTGIGIPEEFHSAIFDAFMQVDSSSTRKYSGTGLGLSIVKLLVQTMGGTLAVESAPGEGTAMHCVLPFDRPEEAAERERQASSRAGGAAGRRLDILVAEDDPVGRFAIREFLRRGGHRVVCTDNGKEALEALLLHRFDCLLTDIQMPVMDGLEATRRIRMAAMEGIAPGDKVKKSVAESIPEADCKQTLAVPSDMPIVALTAHAMTGDREHFLRMGMDLYLSKPVIMKELYAVLDRVADGMGK